MPKIASKQSANFREAQKLLGGIEAMGHYALNFEMIKVFLNQNFNERE